MARRAVRSFKFEDVSRAIVGRSGQVGLVRRRAASLDSADLERLMNQDDRFDKAAQAAAN